jgi:MFS transporter, putative metabolite:H+ symporter
MARTTLTLWVLWIAITFSYCGFFTAFRTTGMGVASAFGRIGGLSAPIVIGYSFSQIGFGGVFPIITVVLVAGALTVVLLGIGTAGKSLEQITRELEDSTAGQPAAPVAAN